jgi:hypothetical protein
MSVIKLPLLFFGAKGEERLHTLFDIGANLSGTSPEFAQKLESPGKSGRKRLISTAAKGHFIEVTKRVSLDSYLHDVLLSDEFLVSHLPFPKKSAPPDSSGGYGMIDVIGDHQPLNFSIPKPKKHSLPIRHIWRFFAPKYPP